MTATLPQLPDNWLAPVVCLTCRRVRVAFAGLIDTCERCHELALTIRTSRLRRALAAVHPFQLAPPATAARWRALAPWRWQAGVER